MVTPADTPHDFENREAVPAGFIALNAPGGFGARIADIAPALAAADLRRSGTHSAPRPPPTERARNVTTPVDAGPGGR